MSVDPKIAKSEMDNLDAALKKGAVTKSKVPSAAVPSGTGNELADIDALLKKKRGFFFQFKWRVINWYRGFSRKWQY